ncbi:unnamed protein product [Caenorhabditis bovis]|uniref:Histone acetyltransferase n=1 Tax=Caenorhabditis bovis TaxID=2654633 RepID=A0A8S1ETZ9_9PELO|nr:unnamed protein product [Caenorhabditis bovis]
MHKVSRKRLRAESSVDDEIPSVNDFYHVLRFSDGKQEKMISSIVHIEYRVDEAALSPNVESGSEEKKLMFYVHYEALDRRNDEWVTRDRICEKLDPADVAAELSSQGRALTRSQRRIHEEFHHLKQAYETMDATTAKLERAHEERTKVKNIPTITIGKYCINSWYYSPFPFHYNDQDLFMCEYCLMYTPSKTRFKNHYMKCNERQPPGNEIYRKDNLSVYEIDGCQHRLYCQSLCLLSKLFMDHKTLYFDVDDFIFYVLCEVDNEGAHIVGYFSREVESANNLACIMVFPPYQNRGYGKYLIQLSYEISSREGYIGTPEKPLSDLGKVSYRSYWWWVLLVELDKHPVNSITATELSEISGIAVDDIISTLGTLKMVKQYKEGEYVIRAARRFVDHCISNQYGKPPKIILDKSCLKWKPAITRREASGFKPKPDKQDARKLSASSIDNFAASKDIPYGYSSDSTERDEDSN